MSGSGSPTIRGILHYVNTWGDQPLSAMTEEQSAVQALRLLTSAAEFDCGDGRRQPGGESLSSDQVDYGKGYHNDARSGPEASL